jgi:predicted nucleic acid-binding protein
MIVVDTCVLVDVIDADPVWSAWSQQQLDVWSARGALIVNPVIYAELSMGFDTIEATDQLVERAGLDFRVIPRDALFLAGKAYALYRRRGGTRTGVLGDFFIGAHAAVLGVPVLTRDVARYASCFRGLELVTPGA